MGPHRFGRLACPPRCRPARGRAAARAATRYFEDPDRSIAWVRTRGKYHYPEQRDRLLALFRQARDVYAALAGGGAYTGGEL